MANLSKSYRSARNDFVNVPDEIMSEIVCRLDTSQQCVFALTFRRGAYIVQRVIFRSDALRNNSSAIHWAVTHCQDEARGIALIKKSLVAGGDINAVWKRDDVQWYPIHMAFAEAKNETALFLIKMGARLDGLAFNLLSASPKLETMKQAKENGFAHCGFVREAIRMHWLPLFIPLLSGDVKLLRELRDILGRGNNHNLPAACAVLNETSEKRGPTPDPKLYLEKLETYGGCYISPLHAFVYCSVPMKVTDAFDLQDLEPIMNAQEPMSKSTALHTATIERNVKFLQSIIQHSERLNLNLNAVNWADKTPLHVAIEQVPRLLSKDRKQHTKVVQLLVRAGANPNIPEPVWLRTPLCTLAYNIGTLWAKYHSQLKGLFRILIKGGADINIADEQGMTPLYYLWKAIHRTRSAALQQFFIRIVDTWGGDITTAYPFPGGKDRTIIGLATERKDTLRFAKELHDRGAEVLPGEADAVFNAFLANMDSAPLKEILAKKSDLFDQDKINDLVQWNWESDRPDVVSRILSVFKFTRNWNSILFWFAGKKEIKNTPFDWDRNYTFAGNGFLHHIVISLIVNGDFDEETAIVNASYFVDAGVSLYTPNKRGVTPLESLIEAGARKRYPRFASMLKIWKEQEEVQLRS